MSKDVSANIGINKTFTRVRGGGFGRGAWIARITGTDPKYRFKREFCRKDLTNLSASGRSGSIHFEVTEPGLYEFRGFCVGSTPRNWEWSGFAIVDENGYREVSQEEAERIAKELDEKEKGV